MTRWVPETELLDTERRARQISTTFSDFGRKSLRIKFCLLLLVLAALSSIVGPTAAGIHHTVTRQTRANLIMAMRGDAFASVKYSLYAEQARGNADLELANLFDKAGNTLRIVPASDGLVIRAVAGYNYSANWAICTGGTLTG
jgi:hypothetical protein